MLSFEVLYIVEMVKTIHIFAIVFYSTSLITSFALASRSVIIKYNLKKDAAAILETPDLISYAKN